MKTLFFITLFAGILVGCDKSDDNLDYQIVDDSYEGYFYYNEINYWYAVNLDHNKYEEWPSGGVYYQKGFRCLTVGTYSINRDKLIFELDSFLYGEPIEFPCNSDLLMPGEYKINYLDNDSLIFKRGNGDSRIIYYLKRNEDDQ